MATLAKLLQVEMGLPEMAERLAAAGRGKDSILAHINPREAKLLKAHGGSGKKNPRTGIMEFADDEETNVVEQPYVDSGDLYPRTSTPPEPKPQNTGDLYPRTSTSLPNSQVAGLDLTPTQPPAVAPAQNETTAETQRLNQYPAPAPAASPIYDFEQPAGAQMQAAAAGLPTPRASGAYPGGSAAPTPASLVPETQQQPGLAQQVTQGAKSIGDYAGGLSDALKPAVPFLKGGLGAFMGITGAQNQRQAQEQAAKTEQELRDQAAQYRTQGQQLVQLGQEGKLTAPQQQLLETQRAVAAQRMASSGVTGGTAQAQIEADLSRQAANFAQQNIDQGNKLLQIADTDVLTAIKQGYAQDQDAQKLANEMYRNVFADLFGGTGNTGSPGQQKITDATEEPQ